MSIRDELLSAGWTSKGIQKCDKCGQEVEVLMSDGGRKQYFETEASLAPAGNWHKFNCGVTFAMTAPAER